MRENGVCIGRRGNLAVRSYGTGRPVLAIHGIPGSASVWDTTGLRLAAAGYRVLAPDLLGFGGSDRPQGVDAVWIDSQVAALSALLEGDGAGPFTVIGHDYGAPVAVALACSRPDLVGGLVLAAGNLFTDTPIPFPLSMMVLPLVGPIVARLAMSPLSLRLMLRVGTGRPRPVLEPSVYLGDAGQVSTIRTIFSAALTDLSTRYAPVESAIPKLTVPRAVIWGDKDPFFPRKQGERAAAALGVDLTLLRNAGHFLPAERPDAFVSAVVSLHRSNAK